jgi:uncharacterized protein YneF (UPF0154 family)
MTTALVSGSLAALAQQSGKSLAESFIHCDAVVIVDTSASMNDRDARGGVSRYKAAVEELTALQNALPGKIAVISFSDYAMFCPGGDEQDGQDRDPKGGDGMTWLYVGWLLLLFGAGLLVGVVGGWVLGIRSMVWYAKSYPEMYAEKMRRATR